MRGRKAPTPQRVKRKVLIVDDESEIRKLLRYTLDAWDLNVMVAGDGVEALDLLRNEPVEIIFADLLMPRMGGLDLMKNAKKVRPSTCVNIMTGAASIEGAVECLRQGACDYVAKPWNLGEVQAIVARCVTHQEAGDEMGHLKKELARREELDRLRSEFVSNMSHELRTPLNAIMGFAKLMAHGKVGPVSPQHQEFLGDILTSSNHLLQLINDVLDLAKVEAGRMEFRPEAIDLSQLVGEVCNILRAVAAAKQIRIDSVVDPACTDLAIDPAKLKQVLYNYLSNALKFTGEGGRVCFRALPEGSTHIRLEVEDSGIGIHADDLPNLFTEFRQLDSSASKKYQGTGLGLALTKRIVAAQGGTVGVASTPGRGSTFYAVLPRVSQPSGPDITGGGSSSDGA